MNLIVSLMVILGGVFFGTYKTWDVYHKGKIQIENDFLMAGDARQFDALIKANLSDVSGCKNTLSQMALNNASVSAPVLRLGATNVSKGATVLGSTLTSLQIQTPNCTGPACTIAGTTYSKNMSLSWELSHPVTSKIVRGYMSGIYINPDLGAGLGVTQCSYAPNGVGAPVPSVADCLKFGGVPNGNSCDTSKTPLNALNISPKAGDAGAQVRDAMLKDLTPNTGSPQMCAPGQAATRLNVTSGGNLQLVCGAPSPSPSPSSSSPPCAGRPPGCQNCVKTIFNMGSGCVCGFATGTVRTFHWDGPGAGYLPSGASCSCWPSSIPMCTSTAPVVPAGSCGSRPYWRCR